MLDHFHVILQQNDTIKCLRHIIHGTGICILYQTPDLLYRWGENLPSSLLTKWQIKKTDEELFSPKFAKEMRAIKNLLLNNLLQEEFPHNSLEIRLGEDNKAPWFRFAVNCHRDENGKIIGLITTGIDISEIKHREKILLREINHRSKNLLAILQSIATLTSRYSKTTNDFLKSLHGRIQSLSLSQDLITDSNWKGAFFHDLVRAQICPHFEYNKICLSIRGENPCLPPNYTLHIGLALHELLINSFFRGAFFKNAGKIRLICNFTTLEDKNKKSKTYCVSHVPCSLYIFIEWLETFPIFTSSCKKAKAQLGNILLESIVPTAVNGHVKYKIEENMFYYSLCCPYQKIKSEVDNLTE